MSLLAAVIMATSLAVVVAITLVRAAIPASIQSGVLIAGGAVAGLVLGARGRSRWAFIRALLTPLALLVPLAFVGLGFSNTAEDLADMGVSIALLFALWEFPLVIGYGIGHVRNHDEFVATPAVVQFDAELDAATLRATIPLVIREYVDDPEGERRLAADTGSLTARGYTVVSIERPRASSWIRFLAAATALAGLGGSPPETKIVATFSHRPSGGSTARIDPDASAPWRVAPLTGEAIGRLDHVARAVGPTLGCLAIAVFWGFSAFAAYFLVAVLIRDAIGDEGWSGADVGFPLFIVTMILGFAGAVASWRVLKRRMP